MLGAAPCKKKFYLTFVVVVRYMFPTAFVPDPWTHYFTGHDSLWTYYRSHPACRSKRSHKITGNNYDLLVFVKLGVKFSK